MSKCTASGPDWECHRKVVAKGLCSAHYYQASKGVCPLREPRTAPNRPETHDPYDMFCRIPEGFRRCTKCGSVKPLTEFTRNRLCTDGLNPACRDCKADAALDSNHGKGAARWKREMLAEQGGACACCGTTDPEGVGWCLHHDQRKTGPESWLAVLCGRCNLGIGHLLEGTRGDLGKIRAYLESELRRLDEAHPDGEQALPADVGAAR